MESLRIDDSAILIGKIKLGNNTYVAQGTILRSDDDSLTIGNSTWVLENTVLHLLTFYKHLNQP